jgi:hypothetical protein
LLRAPTTNVHRRKNALETFGGVFILASDP